MNKTTLTPVITPTLLHELMRGDPTIRLLDVRTPGEYTALHASGAYNVPLDRLSEHASEIRSVTAPLC